MRDRGLDVAALTSQGEHSGGGPTRRVVRFAAWLLGGPLTAVLLVACLISLVSWAPIVLTWNWWPDLDAYASMALAWDHGLLPYRDVIAFNFPGQVYVFWLLGKVFGWGRTWPIYALDVLLLVAFGAVLLAWSRRCLRSFLPGAAGYLCFLAYYLNLGSSLVAQRDWYFGLSIVGGLLFHQMYPNRVGRLMCALLAALATAFRPYTVLFLPAILYEVTRSGADRTGRPGERIRSGLEWLVAFALFTVVAFLPLLGNGLFGDFLRGISLNRPGGPYSRRSIFSRASTLWAAIIDLKFAVLVFGCLLLSRRPSSERLGLVWTWILALGGALLFRSVAPFVHLYHLHPVMLVAAILVALLVQAVFETEALTPDLRLLVIGLVLALFVTGPPASCSLSVAVRTARQLAHGQWPRDLPLGARLEFDWRDYQDALTHLRTRTSSQTRVANLLNARKGVTGLCGEAGRVPVFLYETPSLVMFTMTKVATESEFVSALKQAADSVVVWIPGDLTLVDIDGTKRDLKELTRTVRELYEPSARFGEIEVWTRKPGPQAATSPRPGMLVP